MLNVFAINVVVDTKEGDFYKKVSINQYPIIVFGRTELEGVLKSDNMKKWCQEHFRSPEVFEQARFYIRHCKQDNTCEDLILKCSDFMVLDF